MFTRDFFDNENVLKQFRKSALDEMQDYIQLWLYNVSKDVSDIVMNDLSITCYWSDSRFDRSNNTSSSIDLLVCNNNLEINSNEVREAIKEVVNKNKWIIEDNSYMEEWADGEYYMVEDSINVWKNIDYIQVEDEYIDVLDKWDDLHKYKNKYFPDRLLDAYFIWWNKQILEDFKLKMLDDIISNPSILTKFKKGIKNYYKDEFIIWKNHRNDLLESFNLDENWWLVRFDNEDYYWFKHWPLRSIQYKLVELFLKLVIDTNNKDLIKTFPFDINWRIFFLFNNKFFNLNKDESIEFIEIYTFFKDLNIKLESMFNYEKSTSENILRTDNIWEFKLNWPEYKIKLDRYLELFNKINK